MGRPERRRPELAQVVEIGLAGLDPVAVISTFGKAFNDNRIIAVAWVVLPVVGLLERFGLQQRASTVVRTIRAATVGRLLLIYLTLRQVTAALGLTTVAGHAQTVRPLVAPMALAAAEQQHGTLDEETGEEVKSWSAATEDGSTAGAGEAAMAALLRAGKTWDGKPHAGYLPGYAINLTRSLMACSTPPVSYQISLIPSGWRIWASLSRRAVSLILLPV